MLYAPNEEKLPVMKKEPVALSAAIQAVIVAVIGVLTTFGIWEPTQEQIGTILALYVAVVAVMAGIVRARVTPVAKLQELREGEDA